MGWICGQLDRPFTARAAIAFDLGEEFAERVIDTARYGSVIYAAVRSRDSREVFALILLTERRNGVLCTKALDEGMGPAEHDCPARILDLLTEPSNEQAREWRERCRARLERGRPRKGQKVLFDEPIEFVDGSNHCLLVFQGGSRFRSRDGALYRIPSWRQLDYQLRS